MKIPAVSVFTRHSRTCSHRSDRHWRKCDCTKWLAWHSQGKEYRQSSGTASWNEAAQQANKIVEQYRAAALGEPSPTKEAVRLDAAVLWFLADKESQHLRESTLSKLRRIFQKQMVEWFTDRQIMFLKDVTLPELQAWRATWEDGPLAAKKKQERVRGFFHFCNRNGWIAQNPALGLSKIKADHRPADPFTKEEFQKIYAATDRFGKTEAVRDRMRAMVLLLRWSGLAIRDAVTLERERLGADDRLILRRAKTGAHVMLPLQTNVAAFLRRLKSPNPRYFFWTGSGLPKSAVADWQRALRRLFDLADIKKPDGSKKRCHPHMFRHTFSVEMLLAGVDITDVARLLGHSSTKTTEKYYAPWIKARADRLEEAVRAAW